MNRKTSDSIHVVSLCLTGLLAPSLTSRLYPTVKTFLSQLFAFRFLRSLSKHVIPYVLVIDRRITLR